MKIRMALSVIKDDKVAMTEALKELRNSHIL